MTRFTSVVAIVGIAAGVASLILAQALARGFADQMRDIILDNTSHITVSMADDSPISDWPAVARRLDGTDNIGAVAPVSFANAIILGKDESSYAILKADERNREIDGRVAVAKSGVALGRRLAAKLGLSPGDEADLLTVDRQTPSRVRIAAIFETGLYDYDSTWIYVSPEKFAQLSDRGEYLPTSLSVTVKDIYQSDETSRMIQEKLGGAFRVIDWQEANKPLFSALGLERKVAFAVIVLIIFVAALNITTTLALLVSERRLDIAILRRCGATTRSIITVFLIEGVMLGLTGIAAGVLAGVAGAMAGNHFRLISLSPEVYSLSQIPFNILPESVVLTTLATFILCVFATIFPALAASRIKPLENLRTR